MEKNNKKAIIGTLSLFICSLIWGVTFGVQSKGMDYLEPFSFNGFRSIIAVIFLGLVVLILHLKNKNNPVFYLAKNKKAIIGSIFCGVALFFGTSTQQIGISMTTVGKSGFLSALYIFLVPLLGLFLKKKAASKVWFCVAIALFGLYLLCVKTNFNIELGDIFILLSTLGFASQILIIDNISNDINPNDNIAQALQEQGYNVDKKKIELKDNIRDFGDFEVTVRVYPEITATLKFKVVRA